MHEKSDNVTEFGRMGSTSTCNESGKGYAKGSCKSRHMGKGEVGGEGKSELAASREVVNWKAGKVVPFA